MHAWECRCESLVSELLVQPPSVDTIHGLDEISDTVQSRGHPSLESLQLLLTRLEQAAGGHHGVLRANGLCLGVQICQSYDTAEFCRNVHSCEDWQAAAQQACIKLGGDVVCLPLL